MHLLSLAVEWSNGRIVVTISVMNKRKLHHMLIQLRRVSYWYFLIAAIFFTVVAVFALRQNNLTVIKLRDEVLRVDEENGDTETALKELRQYVYAHMNTDLASATSVYPPIQLKYRYERLVAAEQVRVDKANASSNLYNDAQKYCEQTVPQSFYGAGRLPCIQNYLDTRAAPPLEKEQTIPDSLYKYNFASPVWSSDLAGWSIVLAVFFGFMFVVRYGLELWLRHQFKRHL